MQNLQWGDMQYAKNIRDSKICAKNGMKIAAHKTYLCMRPFGALKIVPQSVGNKNGTKAVLQGWAAAFVPYMLSFTY